MLRSYVDDYAGWIEDTACAVETGRFSEIDRIALADEVRDLGKAERRALESALEVLIMHLLKARYQPQRMTRSWELTMRNANKSASFCTVARAYGRSYPN